MKKIVSIITGCLLSTSLLARTCPPANQATFVNMYGKQAIHAPQGWRIVNDSRSNPYAKLIFRVAAWGDHKHPNDALRCYYYPSYASGYLMLETEELMDASHVASWGGEDPLYYLCVSRSDDVTECDFL